MLEQNSLGTVAPNVPVSIAHGDADQQVPQALSDLLRTKYCRLGAAVTRHVYAKVSHDGVIEAAQEDSLKFIADRFGHQQPTSDCG